MAKDYDTIIEKVRSDLVRYFENRPDCIARLDIFFDKVSKWNRTLSGQAHAEMMSVYQNTYTDIKHLWVISKKITQDQFQELIRQVETCVRREDESQE